MEKDTVIKVRTALKGGEGKNLPVRVYLDNSFAAVDESNVAEFTKWDDTNGLLWIFRLPNPQRDKLPSNVEGCVSVYCCDYDQIQGMEAALVPLKASTDPEKPYVSLDDVFSGMESAGATLSDEYKKLIKAGFRNMLGLGKKYSEITPTHDSLIFGPEAANTKDDWLYGKFTEPRKETARYETRNVLAEERAKEDSSEADG